MRFAWPYERRDAAAANANATAGGLQQTENRDIETGVLSQVDDDDDDRTHRTGRQSLNTLASAIPNPWKIWETVHLEMSRRAAIHTRHLEDEASHVTLARQRNKASRVSSVYNDDDFDFALVLAPHEAYAFWASHLDQGEEK